MANTETLVCLWPDNDWCYKEDLTDFSRKSDDYIVVPYTHLLDSNMTINPNYDKPPSEPYYDKGGIKSLDIIKAKLPNTFTPFQTGLYWNILKYALRAPYKEQLHSDLDKLIQYAQWLKEES